MADYEVVEIVYGKYHRFEIVKRIGTFGGVDFYIHKDGKAYRGSFDSLAKAVQAAKDEG